jgi:hypothetical protein
MLDYGRMWAWFERNLLGRVERQVQETSRVATLDRLKARKLQVRDEIVQKFDPSTADGLDAVQVAQGGEPEPQKLSTPAESAAKSAEAKADQQSKSMSRLLRAKQRARREYGGEE